MALDSLTRDHVPALLLLLVGVSIVLFAGGHAYELSKTEYEYDVSPIEETGVGIYEYEGLSSSGQERFDDAVNASGEAVPLSVTGSSEFTREPDTYYVRQHGEYYCVEVDHSDSGGGSSLSAERDCPRLVAPGPLVHDFSNLSEGSQSVIVDALESPDGEVSREGDTPPDLEATDDTPSFNEGVYFLQYQGNYYRLGVSGTGGPGSGLAIAFLLSVALVGAVFGAVGGASLAKPRTRPPLAVLAGLSVVAVPVLLHRIGLVPGRPVADLAGPILVAGLVVALLTWGGLWLFDGGES